MSVYRHVQGPSEYIATDYGSVHWGVNLGVGWKAAVNFAYPEWREAAESIHQVYKSWRWSRAKNVTIGQFLTLTPPMADGFVSLRFHRRSSSFSLRDKSYNHHLRRVTCRIFLLLEDKPSRKNIKIDPNANAKGASLPKVALKLVELCF